MTTHGSKCVICDVRPTRNHNGICRACEQHIAKLSVKRNSGAMYYLAYQGNVVGLFLKTGTKDTLTGQLVTNSIDALPKSKVVNLDHWCEGYDRDQIKRFKACVKSLAGA